MTDKPGIAATGQRPGLDAIASMTKPLLRSPGWLVPGRAVPLARSC